MIGLFFFRDAEQAAERVGEPEAERAAERDAEQERAAERPVGRSLKLPGYILREYPDKKP
jgi:hypothetical protein